MGAGASHVSGNQTVLGDGLCLMAGLLTAALTLRIDIILTLSLLPSILSPHHLRLQWMVDEVLLDQRLVLVVAAEEKLPQTNAPGGLNEGTVDEDGVGDL